MTNLNPLSCSTLASSIPRKETVEQLRLRLMNINFGLFPPIENRDAKRRRIQGRDRELAHTTRAIGTLKEWLNNQNIAPENTSEW